MATKKSQVAPKAPATAEEEGNEHTVRLTAGPIELPKRQAALTLDVFNGKTKLGTLKVSRGSLSWQVGNRRAQTLPWPQVAALFEKRREKKSSTAAKKQVKKTSAAKPAAKPKG